MHALTNLPLTTPSHYALPVNTSLTAKFQQCHTAALKFEAVKCKQCPPQLIECRHEARNKQSIQQSAEFGALFTPIDVLTAVPPVAAAKRFMTGCLSIICWFEARMCIMCTQLLH
jgi:hypothetical protein